MSWNSFVNEYQKVIPYVEEIGLKKALQLVQVADAIKFSMSTKDLSEYSAKMLIDFNQQTTNLLELYLMTETFSKGPKIFEVDQIDFEMLIQMDINIPMSEYNQPFPTYIIQLPENFRKNRSVACPQAGMYLYGELMPEKHEPDFLILNYEKEIGSIIFGMFFNSAVSFKTNIALHPDQEIETALQMQTIRFKDSLDTTEEEWKLMQDMLRAALNYSLLVDEIGSKRVSNKHEERLKRHLEVAQKSKDRKRILKAEHELRITPIKYELNQEVQLYKSVSKVSDFKTGRVMPPHHRRGHYRMQPCGVGRSERKRIRIDPVFVNYDYFLGNMSKSKTKYK